jgi:hypothetical protein
MPRMTFKEASKFVIEFGKYKGKTLDQIAESDEGLKYLDWIAGWKISGIKDPAFKEAIEVYTSDPIIQNEIGKVVGE